MTRSARDLRLMLQVMSGADIGDPMSAPYELREPANLTNLKVGWFDDDRLHSVTPETKLAVQSAAKALTDQGFEVETFRPDGLERARELWYIIFCRFSGLAFGPMLKGHENDLHFQMRDLLRLQSREKPLSAEDVLFTQFERDTLREQFVRQMDRHRILIMPVSTGSAFRHGQMGWTTTSARKRSSTPWSFAMVQSPWLASRRCPCRQIERRSADRRANRRSPLRGILCLYYCRGARKGV